jgi:hypothetical protein
MTTHFDAYKEADLFAVLPRNSHDKSQWHKSLSKQPLKCDIVVPDEAKEVGGYRVEEGNKRDARDKKSHNVVHNVCRARSATGRGVDKIGSTALVIIVAALVLCQL